MKYCLLFLLISLLHPRLFSQKALQEIHYTILSTLDVRTHSIDASIEINYLNTCADTLSYLWIQLWPNAFKNDRTAYSEYMLDSGSNAFYFSDKEQKGYINHLAFRADNEALRQEDHPAYPDIVKIVLPHPLLPGSSIQITTPFYVRLPYNFSGFGYKGREYTLQNWYPSVALLDSSGWKPEPFRGQQQQVVAAFDVSVTLPDSYILKAAGFLIDSTDGNSLKTYRYKKVAATDFAWLAKPVISASAKERSSQKLIHQLSNKGTALLYHRYLPAIGYNRYDGFQIGLFVHDFGTTKKPTTYFAAPLYAVNSKRITGIAGVNHEWKPSHYFVKAYAGITASSFSGMDGRNSRGEKIFGNFFKIAPYLRVYFPEHDKHTRQWLEWKTFVISERAFKYQRSASDSLYYPEKAALKTRYLNQLTLSRKTTRSLYPYDVQLQLQQTSTFYRINAGMQYYFNYAKGGGLQARIFAGKFGYIGKGNLSSTYRYQPKLTAVRGEEDYTYSTVFTGRNEFDGFDAQQIMVRDGGLKIRTDMFQDLQGRSDNWIASVNFNTTFPASLFPPEFPFRVFFDAGTHAGAWKKQSSQPRFLYVAGLQLSVFDNLLNIYAPLLYSKIIKDNLKSVPGQDSFRNRISFSIDLHRLSWLQHSAFSSR